MNKHRGSPTDIQKQINISAVTHFYDYIIIITIIESSHKENYKSARVYMICIHSAISIRFVNTNSSILVHSFKNYLSMQRTTSQ